MLQKKYKFPGLVKSQAGSGNNFKTKISRCKTMFISTFSISKSRGLGLFNFRHNLSLIFIVVFYIIRCFFESIKCIWLRAVHQGCSNNCIRKSPNEFSLFPLHGLFCSFLWSQPLSKIIFSLQIIYFGTRQKTLNETANQQFYLLQLL